ncbi:type IV pilus biogenesis/stability protein PilW [Lysobacter maris]|uniref:Type IV pilus biogenesis/stability protein PilW n=1 Tax=Marilutibacter maris TaxID=1605891 RepID=A0A508B3Y9_9GAMM|nr:type IV pilus biogenesis/stability protein PilW [Lysobacter maris]
MPRRDARSPRVSRWPSAAAHPLWFCLLLVLLASGCSRLSFVRPDLDKREYTRVAPEYDISDDNRGRNSGTRAAVTVHAGQRALLANDLDSAAEAARTALKLDDSSSAAHTLMGAVYERQGQSARAGEHYRRAAELSPRGAQLNNYGAWLCRTGQASESLEWFERALGDRGYATPDFALANAGSCADKAGLDEKAGRYLAAALRLAPENPVALAAMAEREFRAGDAFKARAFSERRLAAAPADARALMLASQIERQLGDKDAADRYVQRLRAEFPDASGSDTGESGRR